MNKKPIATITGICFIAILAIVFIANIIIKDKSFSEEENRVLQEMPEMSFPSYMEGRLETKLESYASDQFLLRNSFIKIKAAADVTAGKVESNGVYKGKEHYLIEDISTPTEQNMRNTLSSLKSFKRHYKKLDMYFLLAPNAGNILEDKLPTFVKLADQNLFMDEFYKRINKYGYKTIDVRDTFKDNAEDTQLYYHTDHHWTTDGAYLAFKEAAKKMKVKNDVSYTPYVVKNDFRGTLASKSGFVNGQNDAIKIYLPKKDKDYHNSVIFYSDAKKKTTEFYQLDNLDTKDAYTVFGGSNHPQYTIKTPTESRKRLLLVKDSFANSFIPFIAQKYREVVVVDPRYFFDNIDNIIKAEEITDVLFLYNANTFFDDASLQMMLTE